MLSRITSKFKSLKSRGAKAFIPYITAGDPDLETTLRLILELERSGADIIELGVPFSDPMADGPAIQRASERALRNGVTVGDCLDLVRKLRHRSEVPVVLFSYLNPLLSLGADRLARDLRDAGVDGILGTDLVPEEAGFLLGGMRRAGIDTIFLVAPTSPDERIKLVADASSGFVYAIARTGVTGVRESLSERIGNLVVRVKRFTDLPVAVGFGISTHEHVMEVWRHADGAVVGSRIVTEVADSRRGADDVVTRVGSLARWLVSGETA